MQCSKPTGYGPCRKCKACQELKLRSWVFRMQLEAMSYDAFSTTYITFTYSDLCLPTSIDEAKESMQLFFKRLRKLYPSRSIRYVAGLEQGTQSTFRYHWHVILYGVPFTVVDEFILRKEWGNGFIDWKIAEGENMSYVLKYCVKGGCFLMSRRPGIGARSIKILNHAISKLSSEELNKLLVASYAREFVTRSIPSIRVGKYYYPLHRYIKERLLSIQIGEEYVKKDSQEFT